MDVKGEGSEGGGNGEDGNTLSTSPLTIPKSSSFSPKVARPKLPACAGSRSPSRSKTDPGRDEIKAILEDIKNLKKIDFKTFIRPRNLSGHHQHHPAGYSTLPYKSQSTTTSPSQSPRIGSPTVDDPRLTRDRSRSLKMLTDRLKNKSGKLLGEHALQRGQSEAAAERGDYFRREGSVPGDFLRLSHGPSPDRSVERVDEEEEEAAAAESPEPTTKPVNRKVSPGTAARLSPHNSDDSLDSKEAYPYGRNDTPDLHPQPPHSRKRSRRRTSDRMSRSYGIAWWSPQSRRASPAPR